MGTLVDSVVLQPHATAAQVHRAATLAMNHGCCAVCVTPFWVNRVMTMLRGSGVRTCGLISYPFGGSKATLKAIEATSAIKDGADEIEIVAHLPHVLGFDLDGARAELMEIVRAARSTRRDVAIRIIFETSILMRQEGDRAERAIELACRATRESGCDGVVTGTGYDPAQSSGTEAAVVLVKKYGQSLTIKAALIDDVETAQLALRAGADRIGATNAESLTGLQSV